MSEKIYDLDGVRGKHMDVYDDKVVITVKAGLGSFIIGTYTNGEKTIYYSDCIGVQYKKAGIYLGYLQFETANGRTVHSQNDNYLNENSFVFGKEGFGSRDSLNEKMEEVAEYCKKKVEEYKSGNHNQTVIASSPADELKKFKELLDMGAISQEEFDAKKKQILGL